MNTFFINNDDEWLKNLYGYKVKLFQKGIEYEGKLVTVSSLHKKISLSNVTNLSSGKNLQGLQVFFYSEIENLELLEHPDPKLKKKCDDVDPDPRDKRLAQLRPPPYHLLKLQPMNDQELVLSTLLQRDEHKDAFCGPSNVTCPIPAVDVPFPLPSHSVLINEIGSRYFEMLSQIRIHRTICLSLYGVLVGRGGINCWLSIATTKVVILYDLLLLGRAIFDQGLRDVFESTEILKVIHDSRWIADALIHQYNVKLANVFDTQVADSLLLRKELFGHLSRYVRSLAVCLRAYLKLKPEHIAFVYVRLQTREVDESAWMIRPLPLLLRGILIKSVLYLRELYNHLRDLLLSGFFKLSQDHLDHVRTVKGPYKFFTKDLLNLVPKYRHSHIFPEERHLYVFPVRSVRLDDNGFLESNSNTRDPLLLASKQIWHLKVEDKKAVEKEEMAPSHTPSQDEIDNPLDVDVLSFGGLSRESPNWPAVEKTERCASPSYNEENGQEMPFEKTLTVASEKKMAVSLALTADKASYSKLFLNEMMFSGQESVIASFEEGERKTNAEIFSNDAANNYSLAGKSIISKDSSRNEELIGMNNGSTSNKIGDLFCNNALDNIKVSQLPMPININLTKLIQMFREPNVKASLESTIHFDLGGQIFFSVKHQRLLGLGSALQRLKRMVLEERRLLPKKPRYINEGTCAIDGSACNLKENDLKAENRSENKEQGSRDESYVPDREGEPIPLSQRMIQKNGQLFFPSDIKSEADRYLPKISLLRKYSTLLLMNKHLFFKKAEKASFPEPQDNSRDDSKFFRKMSLFFQRNPLPFHGAIPNLDFTIIPHPGCPKKRIDCFGFADNSRSLQSAADDGFQPTTTLGLAVQTFPNYKDCYHLPQDVTVIEVLDQKFKTMMDYIRRIPSIGVAGHGCNTESGGRLFWLCVSTRKKLFLVDILKIGQAAFEEGGLRNTMESNLLKVTHASWWLARVLHMEYGVRLSHVFDTMVADFLFTKDDPSQIEPSTKSLSRCLKLYLGLRDEAIPHRRNLLKAQDTENLETLWTQRPLLKNSASRDYLVKSSGYLLFLHDVLERCLLSEFYQAVQVYMSLVQECAKDLLFQSFPRSQEHRQPRAMARFGRVAHQSW